MSTLARFTATRGVALDGDFDVEAAVARLPAEVMTKGMFLGPLVQKLEPDAWHDLQTRLETPPRAGRYVAYADYSSRDHIRLIDAAARASLPELAPREAHRQIGTSVFERFAVSNIGRVVMRLVAEDLESMLLAFPRGYGVTVRSLRAVEAHAIEGGGVRIVFPEPIAAIEYVLGVLEGIVAAFDRVSTIDVTVDEERGEYDVRWT